VLPDRFRFDISITLLAMVVLGGMGNVWGVTVGALLLAWTNSTMLPEAQSLIADSGSDTEVGIALIVVGLAIAITGLVFYITRRAALLMIYVGVPVA
jgi:branched-chain amino acid transport system permease protein